MSGRPHLGQGHTASVPQSRVPGPAEGKARALGRPSGSTLQHPGGFTETMSTSCDGPSDSVLVPVAVASLVALRGSLGSPGWDGNLQSQRKGLESLGADARGRAGRMASPTALSVSPAGQASCAPPAPSPSSAPPSCCSAGSALAPGDSTAARTTSSSAPASSLWLQVSRLLWSPMHRALVCGVRWGGRGAGHNIAVGDAGPKCGAPGREWGAAA